MTSFYNHDLISGSNTFAIFYVALAFAIFLCWPKLKYYLWLTVAPTIIWHGMCFLPYIDKTLESHSMTLIFISWLNDCHFYPTLFEEEAGILLYPRPSVCIKTFTGDSPMDEDWRNAFGILMCMEIWDGDMAMALARGYAMARHWLGLVCVNLSSISDELYYPQSSNRAYTSPLTGTQTLQCHFVTLGPVVQS